MQVNEERKFLHDIATPMAMIKLIMQRLDEELENPTKEFNPKEMREWIGKAMASMKKLEDMHSARRALVSAPPK